MLAVDGTAAISATATQTTVAGDLAVTGSYLMNTEAITATADGLTTGIISAGTELATVTCGTADYIATLPSVVAGKHLICVTAGAQATEFRTPASSSETINTVDCGGANELAVATGSVVHFIGVSATGWLAYGWTTAGAAIATMTPDAQS